MSQDADAGDDNLDLSALEAAVANLGLEDDDEAEGPPAKPAPGLDLTEAPKPPEAGGSGVSVFDAPDLPDGVEIPDFSGASMVGSAAVPDPDPFDDDDAGSSSGVLPPPPTGGAASEDEGDDLGSTADAPPEMGTKDPEPAEEIPSLPAPDPVPDPVDADVMIETFTAQGGRVKGPLKAVKGLFGR